MKTCNCKLRLIITFLRFIKNIFYVLGMIPYLFNTQHKNYQWRFLQTTISGIIKLGPIRARLKKIFSAFLKNLVFLVCVYT